MKDHRRIIETLLASLFLGICAFNMQNVISLPICITGLVIVMMLSLLIIKFAKPTELGRYKRNVIFAVGIIVPGYLASSVSEKYWFIKGTLFGLALLFICIFAFTTEKVCGS